MEKISFFYLDKEIISNEVPANFKALKEKISKEFSLSSQEMEEIKIYYKKDSKNISFYCQKDYETFLKEKISEIFLEQKKYDQAFLDELLIKKKEFQDEKDDRHAIFREKLKVIEAQLKKFVNERGALSRELFKDVNVIEEKIKSNKDEILKTQKKMGLIKEEEKIEDKKKEEKTEDKKKEEKVEDKKKDEKLKAAPSQPTKYTCPPCRGGQNHFPYKVMQIRAERRKKEQEEKERLKAKALSVSVDNAKNLSVNGEPVFKKVNEVLTDTVEKVKEVVLTEKEKESQIKKIKQITKDTVKEINSLTKLVIQQSNELIKKLEEEEEKKEEEGETKLKSAKLLQEKKEKAKDVTHFMIQCCGCISHNIIKGIRYKCKNCKNVNLCEKCFHQKKNEKGHSEHEFEMIFESEFSQRPKSKNTKYLQRGIVHKNERCNVCGMCPIMGIRYKCTVCDDFNFCENCEEAHATRHNHPLLKLTYSLMENEFNKHYLKLNSFNDGK